MSMSVIGDMTRATLLVKNEEDLNRVVSRIREEFPSIRGEHFQGPNKIGVQGKQFPEGEGGQRQTPIVLQLKFFDGIPEYHQVGTTEMFVPFELQIGLEAKVNGLCGAHELYKEGQILNTQPLLKDYKEAHKKSRESDVSTTAAPSSLIETYRALGQKEIDGERISPIASERLCLNNKRLNIWADQNKA
eukprot:5018571-Ditylum_brightwellii.AAC.1